MIHKYTGVSAGIKRKKISQANMPDLFFELMTYANIN